MSTIQYGANTNIECLHLQEEASSCKEDINRSKKKERKSQQVTGFSSNTDISQQLLKAERSEYKMASLILQVSFKEDIREGIEYALLELEQANVRRSLQRRKQNAGERSEEKR